MSEDCPFCTRLRQERLFHEGELWFTCFDESPVNQGHMLCILKRHEGDLFGVTPEEWAELEIMIRSVKEDMDNMFSPDGYNIGVNVGEAAGQTVPHLHVHVIPRYEGDCENPKGGVRKVKPPLVEY